MTRHFLRAVMLLLLLAPVGRVWGQLRSDLIPAPVMNRFGLVRAWNAQVELDSAQARVKHVTQHVSGSQAVAIIDVVLVDDETQKLATFTDRQLDAFGKPLGVEGAKKAAEERITELRAVDVRAKAVTHVVPEITLYVTTDNGYMHAIDGETGATRWVVPVGRSDHPTFEPAANDSFVAAINGLYLYVFHAADGRLAWRKRLTHAPGAGPAVTRDYVHVPMVPGLFESYHLMNTKIDDRVYQSFGRALLQPVTSPESVIWATDRGYLYVANSDTPGVRFRLETQDEIVARPAWVAPNRVIGVSRDGDVYVVNEFTGAILWRFSTGDPIEHSPLVIENDVYVITNSNIMFRLSSQTGGVGVGAIWSTPGVTKILAASKDRLYCLDHIGRLTILDRASGGRMATLPNVLRLVEFLNHQTDRLFFVSEQGLIQCFHEIGAEYPTIHAGPGMELPGPQQVQQQPLPSGGEPAAGGAPAGEPAAPVNPFGGGAGADPFGGAGEGAPGNPFGAGAPAAPGGASADPFDGGDPFSPPGAGAAPMNTEPAPGGTDPFGGADPFGGM